MDKHPEVRMERILTRVGAVVRIDRDEVLISGGYSDKICSYPAPQGYQRTKPTKPKLDVLAWITQSLAGGLDVG